jgi:hypothetical protein
MISLLPRSAPLLLLMLMVGCGGDRFGSVPNRHAAGEAIVSVS